MRLIGDFHRQPHFATSRFMGNTYVNLTVRGPSQHAVASALSGRTALVSPAQKGKVVVYDEQTEEMSDSVEGISADLSRRFSCPVLAVSIYDDDILQYVLFERGENTDEYNSNPAYFDEEADPDNPVGPSGGNAAVVYRAFGIENDADVERVLRTGSALSGGFTFEIFRHEALCKALRLPAFAVAAGYRYITSREVPPGLDQKDFIKVI
jgi:hypothetical protein